MSVITNMFILTSSKIKSKLLVFRQSILFYPLVFTLIALILFIITSYIDGVVFSDSLSIDTPVLDSLIFTGSADAARSILSTIAAGWATILGVAFSITLITLQLSTSKYTSHLIDRFEQDKINQITLGWFIFIVAYSLLVLKTVRTEDLQIDNLVSLLLNNVSTSNMAGLANFDPSTSFVPVIGVNIAVIIAIVGLFIFHQGRTGRGAHVALHVRTGTEQERFARSQQRTKFVVDCVRFVDTRHRAPALLVQKEQNLS
jgi:uncharacterized membrane protein